MSRFPPGCCSSFLQAQGEAAKAGQVLLPEGALGSQQLPSRLGECWVR